MKKKPNGRLASRATYAPLVIRLFFKINLVECILLVVCVAWWRNGDRVGLITQRDEDSKPRYAFTKRFGSTECRSLNLSLAKRTLYPLSYTPILDQAEQITHSLPEIRDKMAVARAH